MRVRLQVLDVDGSQLPAVQRPAKPDQQQDPVPSPTSVRLGRLVNPCESAAGVGYEAGLKLSHAQKWLTNRTAGG